MKTNLFKLTVALVVILGTVAVSPAKDSPQLADVEQALTAVPAPELPVRAADLVSLAKASEQESVTILAVQTISEINPGSLPSVVGAIGRSVPAMASVAAANAVSFQPKQVTLITRAAVGAAPAYAGVIVSAILEKLPAQYAVVADAAADVAPVAGKEILAAVTATVPALKPYIEKATANIAASDTVPVAQILNQSSILAHRDQAVAMPVAFAAPAPAVAGAAPATISSAAPLSASAGPVTMKSATTLSGPVIGPPPVPLTVAPVEIDPSQTSPQQTGGRNYSSP